MTLQGRLAVSTSPQPLSFSQRRTCGAQEARHIATSAARQKPDRGGFPIRSDLALPRSPLFAPGSSPAPLTQVPHHPSLEQAPMLGNGSHG